MEMLTFCIVVILLSTFTSIANSKPVISLDKIKLLKPNHFAHIFYLNDLGDMLCIDFDLIRNPIKTVNVLKNGQIFRTEDVSEIPENTIFELDITRFKKSNYTIELVTNTHQTIKKDIAIN